MVLGLGYVGRPLALAFRDAGFEVGGFDPDDERAGAAADIVRLTRDEATLAPADVWLVCVPTPLLDGRPDLSAVRAAARAAGRVFRPGTLIVLESTSHPGTAREVLLPEYLGAARAAGHAPVLGRDLFVASSPERMDPGRAVPPLAAIPKVVGGLDAASGEVAAGFYRGVFDEVVLVESAEIAEAAKLLENMYRSVNIALVDEVKTVLAELGVDPHAVVRAAATKPFGFEAFHPGPGPGGHCIPVDPTYFRARAAELGVATPLLDAAQRVHARTPLWVVERVERALGSLAGAEVLVLGLAYKRDIADTRESSAFPVLRELMARGARVRYADPFVPSTLGTEGRDLALDAVACDAANVAASDAVLLLVDHTAWDLALVAEHARLIVDTRDAFRPWTAALAGRLVRA